MPTVSAIRNNAGVLETVQDEVTVEEILQLSVNGNPYTTTMRTPGSEEDLIRGILWTEDVYQGLQNPIYTITEKNKEGYITKANVTLDPQLLGSGIHTQRNLLSVTSCGICGKYEIDKELSGEKLDAQHIPTIDELSRSFNGMKNQQTEFAQTGGCHAAAALNQQGEFLTVKEDIGRHNAVDKVIGYLANKQVMLQATLLLVSGRVSYEIVSKCYRAKIPVLASVSAPSTMAIEYCLEKGIALFAFCRDVKATRYA